MDSTDIEFVVIAGMAKTGTTLPLTLLDGHKDLIVFPEELRFFHLGCDYKSADKVADVLLTNGNIKNLGLKNQFFKSKDYLAHRGTGFGVKDYKQFDFGGFKRRIKAAFRSSKSPRQRFVAIIQGFIDSDKRSKTAPKKIIFVSKAPHNELFINRWNKMLGQNVKYLLCTRIPTEHFTSLKNVAELQGKKLNVLEYIYRVQERAETWSHFPRERTFIIDYDALVMQTKKTMQKVADFLDVPYRDSMLKPTKFGKPWAGNSSRGIVKEKVYKNSHLAKDKLSKNEIATIEYLLRSFYKSNHWKTSAKLDNKLNHVAVNIKYSLISLKNFTKSSIVRIVFWVLRKLKW